MMKIPLCRMHRRMQGAAEVPVMMMVLMRQLRPRLPLQHHSRCAATHVRMVVIRMKHSRLRMRYFSPMLCSLPCNGWQAEKASSDFIDDEDVDESDADAAAEVSLACASLRNRRHFRASQRSSCPLCADLKVVLGHLLGLD
jgi:hypothetical protein